eukprot:15166196-Heterocapsa_arctica.AAC.1
MKLPFPDREDRTNGTEKDIRNEHRHNASAFEVDSDFIKKAGTLGATRRASRDTGSSNGGFHPT